MRKPLGERALCSNQDGNAERTSQRWQRKTGPSPINRAERAGLAQALLIEAIIIMVLVSIPPYPVKKIFLVLVGLICLSSISCFAQSLYFTVSSTPYDKQMTRIRPVLFCKSGGKQDLSLALVNHWIEDIRAIPYGFTPEWKTPAEVESGFVADCKGKAVTLY